MKNCYFEIIDGPEGPCLAICKAKNEGGYRISGPKPWGGGTILYSFKVNIKDLEEQIKMIETT